MRLFELILQNISPRQIAREVTSSIVNARGGNIITVTAKNLLHSIMDAIGYNYYVSTIEIESLNFQWLDQEAMAYSFSYDYNNFDRFQQFLEEICKEMNDKNLKEELIAINEIFLSFCYSIVDEQWENRFWEPFSLISYSLLISMHKIRKSLTAAGDANLVLDRLCHKLFEIAQKGLGHPDSHPTILKGLSVLLGRDYNYFSSHNPNIFKFYSNCMEYEFCRTSGALFVYMQNALENTNVPDEEKRNLVNYLTDPDMIKVYCVFAQQFSKNQVFCLLKFLNSLLSHLPLLECFSRDQVHIILSNALNDSNKARVQAVNFYLTFMRKSKFTNKLIFRDILEFLMMKSNGTEILDCFIESLWDEFPYITELDAYLKVLQKSDWNVKILSVAAQATLRVYKRLYEECDNNDQYPARLSKFLLKLPTLLMLLKDKWQIRGILSHVYSITDFEKAQFTIKEFPIAADRYVKYARRYLNKNGEDYSIIHNTSHNMFQLMYYFDMHEEMEEFADEVYSKYQEVVPNLDQLTSTQIVKFQNTLVMLLNASNIPSAINEEKLFELLRSLQPHLYESNTFQELSAKFNCFLEPFALGIYSAVCIRILSVISIQMTTDDAKIENAVLLHQVYPFMTYLIKRLENSNHSNETIVFIEAAIGVLCDLYINFKFELERYVYHILVNSVNLHAFEAPKASNDDRLRQLELQGNILKSFNSMHKFVDIPVAITWKIAIHFGMVQKFDTELTELMDILLEYNSERFQKPSLFAYIIPVAIFNLYQRQVPLHKFQKALRAHKNYVEEKIKDGTDRIMKIHIVLTMVDMIERSIKAGEFNIQPNRMELLSNMNILLTDIYQKDSNLILTQTRRLEGHALTAKEHQTLTSFQEQLT
ncbi:uncharacterized protein LOC129941288 [Eupeodes corollae]|uniref:uncharacterized protein LOC129941288 n=1 Tax=Eupeodes corollae TaxID=290404 RepID=UPI0024924FEE|nr:uncharacterized protein LOC129941288 [Eupeodes corollae]